MVCVYNYRTVVQKIFSPRQIIEFVRQMNDLELHIVIWQKNSASLVHLYLHVVLIVGYEITFFPDILKSLNEISRIIYVFCGKFDPMS